MAKAKATNGRTTAVIAVTVGLAIATAGWGVLRKDVGKNAEAIQGVERRVDQTETTLEVLTFQIQALSDQSRKTDAKVDILLERSKP